ncbi:MAG: DUF342 domain-containing protein [Bacillota bacterium]
MKMVSSMSDPSAIASANDGGEATGPVAWVTGGQVYVRHEPGGPYPVLKPGPGVELYVNGRRCGDPALVTMADSVEVRGVDETVAGKWELNVSDDGMAAALRVSPRIVTRRTIRDLPPSPILELVAEESREYLPPASLEQILEAMQQHGIVFGIDEAACREMARCADERELTVARGVPPEAGVDGRVEILFWPEARRPLSKTNEHDRVDFRERFQFTSIEPGTVLARKVPPTPGKPGRDVFGRLVPPPPARSMEIVVGKGVVLSADGMEAVAVRSGRPVAGRQGEGVYLAVREVLAVDHDVGIESGNVAFRGDVHITGNVLEGMMVRAGGHVIIRGYVAGATVRAGGGVLISGNVFSSQVTAGGASSAAREVASVLRNIQSRLGDLLAATDQVQRHPAFRQADLRDGPGPLLRLLLERKFRDLPSLVRVLGQAVKLLPPEMWDEELSGLCRQLEIALVFSPMTVRDVSSLRLLAAAARDMEAEFGPHDGEGTDLVVGYALNSTLASAGAVRVVGSGCYNTRILAGAGVVIVGSCRGGEVEAGGDVVVGELGSQAGVKTSVRVPPGSKVTVRLVWEHVQVQVGHQAHRFDRQARNVRLALDREGKLRLSRVRRLAAW